MTPDTDKAPSQLQSTDYVLHIWRRRWWILGITLLTGMMTWLGLRLFHPNQFETRSLIMVRELPRTTNIDDDTPGIEPPSFRSMFTADETIVAVRNQYNQMVEQDFFGDDPGHERIGAPLEKYRSRFRIQSTTTVDTTIRTEFSPVMELRVRGGSQGQALALMNIWVDYILGEFGNLTNEEALFRVESGYRKIDGLKSEMSALTLEREQQAMELRLTETRIASALRQLTSAPIPEARRFVDDSMLPYNLYTGPREMNTILERQADSPDPGLWEEIAALELELAEARERQTEGAPSVAELQRRLQALVTKAEGVQQEIASLAGLAAGQAAELAGMDAALNRVEYAVRIVAANTAEAEALVREVTPVSAEDSRNPASYSTLRLLTEPALPNLRVWPKRTLISAIAMMVMFGFLILIFSAELYLNQAIRLQARREGIE